MQGLHVTNERTVEESRMHLKEQYSSMGATTRASSCVQSVGHSRTEALEFSFCLKDRSHAKFCKRRGSSV